MCEQHMLTMACFLQGAIVTLTKGLAPVLMPKGIRVNAIAPGPVWTPLVRLQFWRSGALSSPLNVWCLKLPVLYA